MDHQRRPPIAEHRVLVFSRAQVHIAIADACLDRAVRTHGEVRHVAGMMTIRTLQSMLFPIRIEVRPRRLEVRSIAFCILVNVDGMLARRQVLHVELDIHSRSSGLNHGGTRAFARAVLELHLNSLPRTRQRQGGDYEWQNKYSKGSSVHADSV